MGMLENKTAVVTGGARGIGRAISMALAAEGAYVIVNCSSSVEKAQETVDEIKARGGQGEVSPCNVADYDAVQSWYAELLKKHEKIDILVNNAGITRDDLAMRMKEEAFDAVIDTNLKGTFNCSKWAAKGMLRKKSGRIINLSSVTGITGNAGQVNYSASKAGVIGLTKSLAREVASRGITVNAVAPGFIETDMTDVLADSVKENAMKQIPLGHFGKPEDVAAAVVFLASEHGRYITGQVIQVDGGMVM